MPRVNLFGDTGESWNESISASECVNMVPFISKTKKSLIFGKMPGTELFYETANGTDEITSVFHISGGTVTDRTYFIVNGATTANIWNIDASTGTATDLGVFFTGSGRDYSWAMNYAESGGTIVVVDNGSPVYATITINSTVASDVLTVISPAIGSLYWVNYFDGYFFVNQSSSGAKRKILSTDFGGTAFVAKNFGLITSKAGSLVRVIDDNRELWAFCDKHIEVWYNAGSEGFPLLRNNAVKIDVGLMAEFSLVKILNSMIFLGVSDSGEVGVYKITGYQLEDITPLGLREDMSDNYADYAYAYSRAIMVNNYSLYVLNTYSASGTWVYNITSGLWSKEKSDGLAYSKYQVTSHTSGATGKFTSNTEGFLNLVVEQIDADTFENRIDRYVTDKIVEVEDGTSPYKNFVMKSNFIVGEDNNQVIHKRLQIKFNPIATTLTLKVEFSDDEEVSWDVIGTFDITDTVEGLIDLYGLGASRKRIYRITSVMGAAFTDKLTLTDAWLNIEQLNA